jgi:hypothetical protein
MPDSLMYPRLPAFRSMFEPLVAAQAPAPSPTGVISTAVEDSAIAEDNNHKEYKDNLYA